MFIHDIATKERIWKSRDLDPPFSVFDHFPNSKTLLYCSGGSNSGYDESICINLDLTEDPPKEVWSANVGDFRGGVRRGTHLNEAQAVFASPEQVTFVDMADDGKELGHVRVDAVYSLLWTEDFIAAGSRMITFIDPVSLEQSNTSSTFADTSIGNMVMNTSDNSIMAMEFCGNVWTYSIDTGRASILPFIGPVCTMTELESGKIVYGNNAGRIRYAEKYIHYCHLSFHT